VQFPYTLERLGVIMRPQAGNPFEAEGVLNPAAAVAPNGEAWLYPRIVAAGNRSRIGRARFVLDDGVPSGVERHGTLLAPDRGWEHGSDHGGVEDPRLTWIAELGIFAMVYVAYGPIGPRGGLLTSPDLQHWTRLGPVQFAYDDALGVDLNVFPNKDFAWFPEPVTGPDGSPCFALLHRPMWEIEGQEPALPNGITDPRSAIWISYVRADDAKRDTAALTRPFGHKQLAASQFDWESLKIGGGAQPVRVPEGWLLLYHGVSGVIDGSSFTPQKNVLYCAGGMILDADDPTKVLARTSQPLLSPETDAERLGTVGNVVFPTAVIELDGVMYALYGMADAAIGVARIDRSN